MYELRTAVAYTWLTWFFRGNHIRSVFGGGVDATTGAAVFKLYESNDAPVRNTEVVGIVLIICYMGSDSFTSNWQSKVRRSGDQLRRAAGES